MLGSFLAEAKATIRRAGVVDRDASRDAFLQQEHNGSNTDNTIAERSEDHDGDGDDAESAVMSSMSLSFSRLKAASAASVVNKVSILLDRRVPLELL